jgi:hypothetical protein
VGAELGDPHLGGTLIPRDPVAPVSLHAERNAGAFGTTVPAWTKPPTAMEAPALSLAVWSTVTAVARFSQITDAAPTSILAPSASRTAPYMTLALGPTSTSPTSVAVGAT